MGRNIFESRRVGIISNKHHYSYLARAWSEMAALAGLISRRSRKCWECWKCLPPHEHKNGARRSLNLFFFSWRVSFLPTSVFRHINTQKVFIGQLFIHQTFLFFSPTSSLQPLPPSPQSSSAPSASKPKDSNSNTSYPHSPAKTSDSAPPTPQTNKHTTPSPSSSNRSSQDGTRCLFYPLRSGRNRCRRCRGGRSFVWVFLLLWYWYLCLLRLMEGWWWEVQR